MSISLSTIAPPEEVIVVALPDNGVWVDRHDWQQVVGQESRSADGILYVETSVRSAGRPVTLSFDTWAQLNDSNKITGYLTKSQRDALVALYNAAPPANMTLSYHGESYTVRWRRGEGDLALRPILSLSGIEPSSIWYRGVLRLITVA